MKRTNIYRVELVKEKGFLYEPIQSAVDVVKILQALGLNNYAEEVFTLICLDTKGNVCGLHEVSRGDVSSSPVHPREVFKRALLNNATSVILAHNHPSGSPDPSSADIQTTERLQEAGNLLGIRVLDHIIVADDDYISMKANGYMNV